MLSLFVCFGRSAAALILPETLPGVADAYRHARSSYKAAPGVPAVASRFSRACFELAEYATNDTERASLANEGITAAREAVESDPENGGAHFNLALNLGELARTKSLGALSLIRQMEKELLRAIELDPHVDHAGPDRSLGMLYLDAPGWPASVGSKKKAHEHLEHAVEIEPDYPDNHLSLMEAYARWSESGRLSLAAERYRKLLPEARQKYSGDKWKQAWVDWDERWNDVQRKVGKE